MLSENPLAGNEINSDRILFKQSNSIFFPNQPA
jgi:hypothetical protein